MTCLPRPPKVDLMEELDEDISIAGLLEGRGDQTRSHAAVKAA